MQSIKREVARLVEESKDGSLSWEFDENSSMAMQYSRECVPGRIVDTIDRHICDQEVSNKVIGLLACYSARRSLAAWCVYCDSVQPISVIDNVISYWLYHSPLGTTVVDEPSENGVPIVDCRWGDTKSAAKAVEHAAEFALKRDRYSATLSLMDSFLAFALSPVGSLDTYVEWLVDFAVPCAVEFRRMTVEEEFALADYEIPEALRRTV